MLPYILYIIILIFTTFVEISKTKVNYGMMVGVIFFSFLLLAGLTDGNGLDWFGTSLTEGYGLIDYRALGFDELKRFEPGFVLVNIILGNFHLFIFTMCFVCFLMVWRTIKWGCNYRILALFVFLSSMTLYCYMGVYRHAIAQTVLICSWQYFNDRKKLALFVVIACTFHISASIALLYLFIPRSKVVDIKFWALIALIAFIIRPHILPILMNHVMFLPGESLGKIILYMNADDFDSGVSMLLLLSKLLLFLFAYNYFDRKDEKQSFLLNMYALSILLLMIISLSPTFARMSLFFSCAEILLIPITFEKIISKRRIGVNFSHIVAFPYFLFVIVLYTYSYFNLLIPFSDIYIPYKSILG